MNNKKKCTDPSSCYCEDCGSYDPIELGGWTEDRTTYIIPIKGWNNCKNYKGPKPTLGKSLFLKGFDASEEK